jgi:hypothetical protein
MRKRVRRISCVLRKKKGEELTIASTGTRHPLPSGGTVTRGVPRTSSSSSGTTTGGHCGTVTAGAGNSSSFGGTSSSGGTVTEGPYGTGTSSSSGGTTTVLGCDNETSSSTTRMCFTLGTSSSLYITCIGNWSGETGSWRRRWRRRLDSPDEAMARV